MTSERIKKALIAANLILKESNLFSTPSIRPEHVIEVAKMLLEQEITISDEHLKEQMELDFGSE